MARHKEITTNEDLGQLLDDSVIRDHHEDVLVKSGDHWHYGETPVLEPRLPATVLWEPNA